MFHVAINTPNGRWLQADFQSLDDMWAWVAVQILALREKYGAHAWFPIPVEDCSL